MSEEELKALLFTVQYAYSHTDDYVNWNYVRTCEELLKKEAGNMAIRQEVTGDLVRTWSDLGMKIHGGFPEGDYDEAVDPVSAGRIYTETDIPVDPEQEEEEQSELEAKAAAYDILVGE